jgi:hypothetical protein
MNMKQHFWLIACLAILGCGPELHMVDVTGDARFQSGYRAGQVWRLKTQGYLVRDRPGAPWELWTAADLIGQQVAEKQAVPAGSVVRIQRLGYLYNSEHPPVPGGTLEEILAYGTLTMPAGTEWPQSVTILPGVEHPMVVGGTSLVVYGPDRTFLEEAEGKK